jgi:glycosyltransferase involved in cell wall biosynthesis
VKIIPNNLLKICIAGRGDITNRTLWSGTPKQINDQLSQIKNIEVSKIDWSLFKPIFSFYCVVISKFLFTWGSANDPLLYWLGKITIIKKIKKLKTNYDYILFSSGDMCVPKEIVGLSKYAYYTDIFLSDVIPYYKKLKFGHKSFLRHYDKRIAEQYNRCEFIFTQNEWTKNSIVEKLHVPIEKVINVGFGVNLVPFTGEKDYSTELLLIVLRKGTEQYKGLYLLLDAFKILRKRCPQVRLAVVGTDEEEKVEGVTYYYNQPRETTVELFKQCTLYTMPAIREPNGVTYLEALANKAPIVGLNRFAVPEFCGDGEWGFMADNEDPEEIANVIENALSDKERLKEMGLKGQQFVMERYSWEIVVEKMLIEMKKVR